jgi:hypothetical protein
MDRRRRRTWDSSKTTMLQVVQRPSKAYAISIELPSDIVIYWKVLRCFTHRSRSIWTALGTAWTGKLWCSISFYLSSTTKPLIKWARAWSHLNTFKARPSRGDSVSNYTLPTLSGSQEFGACFWRVRFGFDSWNLINAISTPRPEGLGLISVSQVTLGPVKVILSWVFLDMWDVKSKCQVAGKAASEVLLRSLSLSNSHLIDGLRYPLVGLF